MVQEMGANDRKQCDWLILSASNKHRLSPRPPPAKGRWQLSCLIKAGLAATSKRLSSAQPCRLDGSLSDNILPHSIAGPRYQDSQVIDDSFLSMATAFTLELGSNVDGIVGNGERSGIDSGCLTYT